MNSSDQEYIAVLINYFWGEGAATPSAINGNVINTVYEVLLEAQSCSSSMDLVPRPSGSVAGIGYSVSQLVNIGKRIASGDTRLYITCKNVAAARYKTKVILVLRSGG
ncbi:hypothetical protein [Zooshikella sp. RANM57]|uniref:hypothetical protein n=1 Tax=Zooshikella sp. RANM57 TaxID=3425863 RepID=UPI003D6F6165